MDRRNRRLPDVLFQLQGQAVYPHNRLNTKNHIRENVRRLKDLQTTNRQQKQENQKKVPLKATVRYANIQSKVGKLIKDPKLPSTKGFTEEVAEKTEKDEKINGMLDGEGGRASSAHSDYSSLNASLSPSAARQEKQSPEELEDESEIFVEGTKLRGVEIPTPRKNESVLINTECGIMPREDVSSGRLSRRDVFQYSRKPRSASQGRVSSGRLTQTYPLRSASSGRSSANSTKIYSIYGRPQSVERPGGKTSRRPLSVERTGGEGSRRPVSTDRTGGQPPRRSLSTERTVSQAPRSNMLTEKTARQAPTRMLLLEGTKTQPQIKQNMQDFKKQNVEALRKITKSNDNSKKSVGNVVPTNYKKGAVPKYLRERQEQWKLEEEKKLFEKKMGIPPGHIMMPEQERLQTLKLLEERRNELTKELMMLPIRNDTLRLQNKRADIHSELQRLDEGIVIFSRPKVFVKQTP